MRIGRPGPIGRLLVQAPGIGVVIATPTLPVALAPIPLRAVLEVIANVLLGLAFLWAGALKLAQGPSWSKQAADMGVSRPVALVVPYVEIGLGAWLVSQLFSPWAAVAALVLLVSYTGLILLRLRDGSRPPCACFGSRSMRPLGAYHVLRNAGLTLVGAIAVVAA